MRVASHLDKQNHRFVRRLAIKEKLNDKRQKPLQWSGAALCMEIGTYFILLWIKAVSRLIISTLAESARVMAPLK